MSPLRCLLPDRFKDSLEHDCPMRQHCNKNKLLGITQPRGRSRSQHNVIISEDPQLGTRSKAQLVREAGKMH